MPRRRRGYLQTHSISTPFRSVSTFVLDDIVIVQYNYYVHVQYHATTGKHGSPFVELTPPTPVLLCAAPSVPNTYMSLISTPPHTCAASRQLLSTTQAILHFPIGCSRSITRLVGHLASVLHASPITAMTPYPR